MLDFYLKIVIYLAMFIVSFYALNSLDFNRFLKKNSSANGLILYIVIALIMAYLLGEFIISITFYFNK